MTLEVNDAEQAAHPVMPDDGRRQRYKWRMAKQCAGAGRNGISRGVKPDIQYWGGVAIYHLPFSSKLETEYIEYVLVSGAAAGVRTTEGDDER